MRNDDGYWQADTFEGESTGKKKKNKNIKVTEDAHHRLGELGKITEDYDDIVMRLLDFWEEHHPKND
jgi:hypothetical protein